MILFSMTKSHAQNKQDYYWPFAFSLDFREPSPGLEINFNDRPVMPEIRNRGLSFDQNNASICDKDGNLLFYTNGCAVANRNHEIMPNGEGINESIHFQEFWGGDCARGYPGPQNITILEDPNNERGYYIIHKIFSYSLTAPAEDQFNIDSIKFSYVDMSLDNGYGDVVEKNINFYQDNEFPSNYLTSIAQSNGVDWWIINPVFPQGYLIFSLDEEGIKYDSIHPGPIWNPRKTSAAGHARFSPDGTKYALFNQFDGLYIYDFDRSDGTLSNEQHLPWEDPGDYDSVFATCEWSPNSRYLYLSEVTDLWQLDTEAEALEDGLVYIAEWQGGADRLQPSFGIAALGPDCRIYIRGKSSANSMHIIHKPDEPGLACDFVEQGIRLPATTSAGSFPNFPRFRVDEEDKCDPSIVSIVGETVWWRRDLTAYPSPASEYVTVELPEDTGGLLYMLDMQGQIVLRQSDARSQQRLDISGLPPGIYSVEFIPEQNEERVVYTRRVMVE